MTLEITSLSVDKIKLPNQLIKEHPPKQIKQIADSIETFGFNDPVAIDEKYEIIEGVGRVLAAKELKLKTIPVIVLKHLSDAQKQAYRIAHNKICLNSEFNLEALRLEFEAIVQLNDSLLAATGFESIELEDLLAAPVLPDVADELTQVFLQESGLICPHCGKDIYA